MKNYKNIYNIFIYFIIYAFIGWIIESVYMSFYHGHPVNRGFLMLPFCGVYGVGALFVIYILGRLRRNPLVLFIGSAALTTVIELVTGIMLKAFFRLTLWDYSEKLANFRGYICLENSLIWGGLSVIAVYLLHPAIARMIHSIPLKIRQAAFLTVFICLITDLSVSVYTAKMGIDKEIWLTQKLLEQLKNIEFYFINH